MDALDVKRYLMYCIKFILYDFRERIDWLKE